MGSFIWDIGGDNSIGDSRGQGSIIFCFGWFCNEGVQEAISFFYANILDSAVNFKGSDEFMDGFLNRICSIVLR